MNSSIAETWADVAALGDEWNGLLEDSKADSIFLTWEWIHAWSDVVGNRYSPFVIAVRDDKGCLAAIAPYYRTEFRLAGFLPFKTLRILADQATGAEYGDWILRRDCEQKAAQCVVSALIEHHREWDCIWMPNMSGWSGCGELIRKVIENNFFFQGRMRDFACIDLPEGIDDYLDSLTMNRKQQLKRQKNALSKGNRISFVKCLEGSDLPTHLDALFRLNHERWAVKGILGTFRRKPQEALFYRTIAPVALERGWLRIYGLEINGILKAVQFGYVYKNVYHQLQEGFSPRDAPGAGNVLRSYVIEDCIQEGLRQYDFLGEMTEHKRRWNAQLRTGSDLFIGRKCMINRLLFTKPVWPTGKFLRPLPAWNGTAS